MHPMSCEITNDIYRKRCLLVYPFNGPICKRRIDRTFAALLFVLHWSCIDVFAEIARLAAPLFPYAVYYVDVPLNETAFAFPADIHIEIMELAVDPVWNSGRVTVFVNSNAVATLTNQPFKLSLTNLLIGTYKIAAVSTDLVEMKVPDWEKYLSTSLLNNVTIIVTNYDNRPPSVKLRAPGRNFQFVQPATIRIDVEAVDPENQMAKVEVYDHDKVLVTFTNAPYVTILTNYVSSNNVIRMRATATDSRNISVSTMHDFVLTTGLVSFVGSYSEAYPVVPVGSSVRIHATLIQADNNIYPIEVFDGTSFVCGFLDPFRECTVSNLSEGLHEYRLSIRNVQAVSSIVPPILPVLIRAGELRILNPRLNGEGRLEFLIDGVQGIDKSIWVERYRDVTLTNLNAAIPVLPTFNPWPYIDDYSFLQNRVPAFFRVRSGPPMP